MNTARPCAIALALLSTALSAGAVDSATVTAALRPPATPLPASAPAASAGSAFDKRVLEDGQVRIEEGRVRGQTQVVTVQSKIPGVKPYEVIMPPLGKDPSQDKGAAGKRTWSIFDF
jgi:hypothetical protein